MTHYSTMTICGYRDINQSVLKTHQIKNEALFVYITKADSQQK